MIVCRTSYKFTDPLQSYVQLYSYIFNFGACIIHLAKPLSTSSSSQCVTAIRSGLCVLAVLVGNPDSKEKMADWGVSDMLELVTAKFPDFATRSELCHRITTNLPGYVPPPDTKEELTRKQYNDIILACHL